MPGIFIACALSGPLLHGFAMAFQSGITPSANDLLDKIRLFATSVCGYEQRRFGPIDGSYLHLHLAHPASGQIVNLRSYSGALNFYGSTAFDNALSFGSQVVASSMIGCNLMSGNAEYFLFGDDGRCYCAVQKDSTSFSLCLFGRVDKVCEFTGGAFVSSTWDNRVRADIDGRLNRWKSGDNGLDAVYAFRNSVTRELDSTSPIAFNGVTPLYPAIVEVGCGEGYVRTLLGEAPGVRLLRMAGQYVNKDIITLGSQEWMVFNQASSGGYYSNGAYAFLK